MPSSTTSADSPPSDSASLTNEPRAQKPKKHVCQTCERAFTTSGHLARHSRVHTGERNHACPYPGCNTRCSRQDNLQQHYRVHLSPRSRNISTSAARAAMARTAQSQPYPSSADGTSLSPLAAPQYRATSTTTTSTWWPDPTPAPYPTSASSSSHSFSSSYPMSSPTPTPSFYGNMSTRHHTSTPIPSMDASAYSPPAPIPLGARSNAYLASSSQQSYPSAGPSYSGYQPQLTRGTWKVEERHVAY